MKNLLRFIIVLALLATGSTVTQRQAQLDGGGPQCSPTACPQVVPVGVAAN
jgi:hypothetical protein